MRWGWIAAEMAIWKRHLANQAGVLAPLKSSTQPGYCTKGRFAKGWKLMREQIYRKRPMFTFDIGRRIR